MEVLTFETGYLLSFVIFDYAIFESCVFNAELLFSISFYDVYPVQLDITKKYTLPRSLWLSLEKRDTNSVLKCGKLLKYLKKKRFSVFEPYSTHKGWFSRWTTLARWSRISRLSQYLAGRSMRELNWDSYRSNGYISNFPPICHIGLKKHTQHN